LHRVRASVLVAAADPDRQIDVAPEGEGNQAACFGVRGSALYDGSWSEWGLPDGPLVATGPA